MNVYTSTVMAILLSVICLAYAIIRSVRSGIEGDKKAEEIRQQYGLNKGNIEHWITWHEKDGGKYAGECLIRDADEPYVFPGFMKFLPEGTGTRRRIGENYDLVEFVNLNFLGEFPQFEFDEYDYFLETRKTCFFNGKSVTLPNFMTF